MCLLFESLNLMNVLQLTAGAHSSAVGLSGLRAVFRKAEGVLFWMPVKDLPRGK